jgi:hypothetical protein
MYFFNSGTKRDIKTDLVDMLICASTILMDPLACVLLHKAAVWKFSYFEIEESMFKSRSRFFFPPSQILKNPDLHMPNPWDMNRHATADITTRHLQHEIPLYIFTKKY